MKLFILLLTACVLLRVSDGKVFTKCQIAKELGNYKGVDRSYISNCKDTST